MLDGLTNQVVQTIQVLFTAVVVVWALYAFFKNISRPAGLLGAMIPPVLAACFIWSPQLIRGIGGWIARGINV